MSVEESIRAYAEKKQLFLLTEGELSFLPKIFLISFAPEEISFVWNKLPLTLRQDKEMKGYQRCTDHIYRGRTQIDGPPPRKNRCPQCIKTGATV